MWQTLETSVVVAVTTTRARGAWAPGIKWADYRDADKHPTMHGTVPTTKNVMVLRLRNPVLPAEKHSAITS